MCALTAPAVRRDMARSFTLGHRRMSDLTEAKRRARKAWLQAKRVNAVPAPLADRWYSYFLLAVRDAPPAARLVMSNRTI
jgi:hypothetical protein